MLTVQILWTDPSFADLELPKYASEGSAGMDLPAAIREPLVILPGGIALVSTALSIALPDGYEAQVRSRSGLALRGILCLNSPGTIDSDYRGEIKVILGNIGHEPFTIHRGDRIAQLVIARYERVKWERIDELPSTSRGKCGFGSTGI